MFSFFRKKRKPQGQPSEAEELESPADAGAEAAVAAPEVEAGGIDVPVGRAPEDLCGVTPEMSREEIRARLAMLFRRHNRAASSLDESLRAEAEVMLEAIVAVRRRFLEVPPAGDSGGDG